MTSEAANRCAARGYLTEAEKRNIRLWALGFTCAESAPRLKMTPAAVNAARYRIRIILGAANGPHAVHIAHTQGILTSDEGVAP